MKKILAICVAFLCVAVAMAEKRIIRSVLLSVPIDYQYVHEPPSNKADYNYGDDGYTMYPYRDLLKSTSVNVEFNKMRVKDSNFSTIFGIGLGYTSSKWDDSKVYIFDSNYNRTIMSFDSKYNLFNMNLKFGLGGAFVNTEKVILAMHGFIGMSAKIGKSNDEWKTLLFSGTGHAGFDFALAVLFTESIGLSAGLDVAYMGGWVADQDYLAGPAHGFSIVPKVGVAFAF